jgi:hypothetical protein
MNYFQKVTIRSNEKLTRVIWDQNGEEVYLHVSCGEAILYRKFNSYSDENIKMYFEGIGDSFMAEFTIKNNYKPKIEILINFLNTNAYELFIDCERVELYN